MDLATYDRWRTFPDRMTPEEAATALRALADVKDIEVAHSQADDILCSLLRYYEQDEVVALWADIDKWYA